MARKLAPCGTVTAYNRHRRNDEEACDACKAAKAEQAREARAPETIHLDIVPNLPAKPTRLEQLRAQREVLSGLLSSEKLIARDAAAISRELRAVWAEIAELDKGEGEGQGGDSLDPFAGGLRVVPLDSA